MTSSDAAPFYTYSSTSPSPSSTFTSSSSTSTPIFDNTKASPQGYNGNARPGNQTRKAVAALENVSYQVGTTEVIKEVDLELYEGEIVCLLGPSGCGKSTLLRMVAGLNTPSTGRVLWKGEPFTGVNPGAAIVFQNFALFPWLTVLENVELGIEAQNVPVVERRKRALKAIDTIGLDGYENAFPRELSGGMRQRIGFARALAVRAELLCMDEPFSALDVLTAENLRSELLRLWQAKELPTKAILVVTHGIEEAVAIADRVVLLGRNPGHIRTTLQVNLKHPRDRKSAAFQSLVDHVYTLISSPEMEIPDISPIPPMHRPADMAAAPAPSSAPSPPSSSSSGGVSPWKAVAVSDFSKDVKTSEQLSEPLEVSSDDENFSGDQPSLPKKRYPMLPAVRIGSVAGLLSFLDEDIDIDLSSLGQELQLELDDLVPIVDAAELLGLISIRDGDVHINVSGKQFLRANIDERKAIVRSGMRQSEEAKLIEQILVLLQRSKKSRVPQELIFDTILLKHFSPQEAKKQLEIAIEWGRFAELFGYDAPAGELFMEEENGDDVLRGDKHE